MPLCEFDRLFTKSIPHILEKIFFSLDFDSFVACRSVCRSWNGLHSSEMYQRKAEELLNSEVKLCQSSWDGNVEEVGNLLSSGVSPNCTRVLGDAIWLINGYGTPLIFAATNGHLDVVELLLNAGANPNKPDMDGVTPLHCATHDPQMWKMLINALQGQTQR